MNAAFQFGRSVGSFDMVRVARGEGDKAGGGRNCAAPKGPRGKCIYIDFRPGWSAKGFRQGIGAHKFVNRSAARSCNLSKLTIS